MHTPIATKLAQVATALFLVGGFFTLQAGIWKMLEFVIELAGPVALAF